MYLHLHTPDFNITGIKIHVFERCEHSNVINYVHKTKFLDQNCNIN